MDGIFADWRTDRPANENRRRNLHQHPRGRRARLSHDEPRPRRQEFRIHNPPHTRCRGRERSFASPLQNPVAQHHGLQKCHRRARLAPRAQPQRAVRHRRHLVDSSREVHGRVVGDDFGREPVVIHQRLSVCATRSDRLRQIETARQSWCQQRERAPIHRLRL